MYSLVVALHVVSLSFCAGPVIALALGSRELSPSVQLRLARVANFGLLGLLLTGIAAVAMTGPAFVHAWWFRVAMVLFLVIGGLTGWLRRLTRAPGSGDRVRTVAWTITVALALAVYLMEGKPF